MEPAGQPLLVWALGRGTLRLAPDPPLDDDALFELCARNRDLRIERTAAGELLIMPPTGGETGRKNLKIAARLEVWSEADGTGVAFDSSTGFLLPNGAQRSPDAAWVAGSRWAALTEAERRTFPPLCPDFVVELRSPTDRLTELQAKMREYIDNGARLGWLIDVDARVVWVYRGDGTVERADAPAEVRGDPVLAGFVLRTAGLW